MKKWWLILVAVWKIIVWAFKRDAEKKAKQKQLQEAVNDAIKKDDTRSLHRIMSEL